MKLRIKLSAALFVALMTVFFEAWLGWQRGLIAALLLSACVLAHEFGHALLAWHFKVKVKEIGFGVEAGYIVRERSDSLAAEAIITSAGVLTNVLLFGLLLSFQSRLTNWVAWCNLAVAGANLIPLGPSDGSRLLRLAKKAVESRSRGRTLFSNANAADD